jgi:tetratricopeptide (TPR) repeat protein
VAAIVCKGSLAQQGLVQTAEVLEKHPDSWIALYSQGMNHLHWPRALRHSDDAADDLARCVEIHDQRHDGEPPADYLERIYVALGQAHAKAGDAATARQVWQRGLERFPDSAELTEHLAVADPDALLALVQEKRSLEQILDTDLSFYPAVL